MKKFTFKKFYDRRFYHGTRKDLEDLDLDEVLQDTKDVLAKCLEDNSMSDISIKKDLDNLSINVEFTLNDKTFFDECEEHVINKNTPVEVLACVFMADLVGFLAPGFDSLCIITITMEE